MSTIQREETIEAHLPLVRAIATFIGRSLPRYFDRNDLEQTGVLGLLNAVNRYDPAFGCSFGVYARFRIRGAILDSVQRAYPHIGSFKLTKDILSKDPSIEDVITARQILSKLPERERIVLEMRFIDGATLASIGERFQVTKQRVAKIRDYGIRLAAAS